MSLKVAGVQHQAPVALGTVAYSPVISGTQSQFVFSGDAILALFAGSGALNNSTPTSGAKYMLGASDGTTSFVERLTGADAVTTSAWRTSITTAKAAGFINSAGTELSYATASLTGSGAQLNWPDVDVANRVGSVVFGGAGIEAQVINTAFTGAVTLPVTHALSGPPDLVIAVMSCGNVNTVVTLGRSSVSFFARTAGTYVCVANNRVDSATTEQALQYISTLIAGGQLAAGGTFDYTFTYSNFTASTFDVVPSADASTDAVSFVLLKGPGLEVKTGVIDLPSNTTQFQAVSGLTKRPKAILTLPTMMSIVNGVRVNDDAGWVGFGAAWENAGAVESFTFGIGTDDAATGTNALANKSLSAGILIQTWNPAGTASALVGVSPTFRNDGLDLAMTTADTVVRKLPYMTIGDTAPGVTLQDTSVDPLIDGQNVVLTSSQSSFGASGNVIAWGSQSFTASAQSTDAITAAAVIGSQLYGEAHDLTVTVGATVSNSVTLNMMPPSGQRHYDLSGGLNSTATIRFEALPDLIDNAQIHVSAMRDSTGAPASLTLLDILADGTPSIARSVSLPAQIDARANNRDGQGWGAVETITVGLAYLTVVDERGLGEAAAVADLQSLGFSVRISRTSSLTITQGLVISQLPLPGAQVPLGTEVELIVSLGAGNAPSGLTGFALSAGSVRLNWTAPT